MRGHFMFTTEAMKSQFEILISFRTPNGFKACGQYFLGDDPVFAETVFAGLTGCEDVDGKAILHLDLLEMSDGVPEMIRTISCRLNELCGNLKHITCALFREHAITIEEKRPAATR